MPHPSSDRQRPSLYTLNRVAKALQSPGTTYEMVSWECFISREEEERLVRAQYGQSIERCLPVGADQDRAFRRESSHPQ